MATTTLPAPERMWPIKDVAGLLSVHRRTVQREIDRGHLLPIVMIGSDIRIPESTLSKYISDRMVRPAKVDV